MLKDLIYAAALAGASTSPSLPTSAQVTVGQIRTLPNGNVAVGYKLKMGATQGFCVSSAALGANAHPANVEMAEIDGQLIRGPVHDDFGAEPIRSVSIGPTKIVEATSVVSSTRLQKGRVYLVNVAVPLFRCGTSFPKPFLVDRPWAKRFGHRFAKGELILVESQSRRFIYKPE